MNGPRHLVCTAERCDCFGVDEDLALGNTLEHHSEVEALPLGREVQTVEVAAVGVTQADQVAVILFRTVAGTHLVVDAAVGIGKCQIANVAAANLTIRERLIAGMSFLVLLVFLQTRPVAIGLVTPNGVHSIAFE